jgi:hypothetical protein
MSPVAPGWMRTSMNRCEFGHWSCPENEVVPSIVVIGVLLDVRGFETLFVIPLFDPYRFRTLFPWAAPRSLALWERPSLGAARNAMHMSKRRRCGLNREPASIRISYRFPRSRIISIASL